MKNAMRENHQATEAVSGSRSGTELFFGDSVGEKMFSVKPHSYQGAIGIAIEIPNCLGVQAWRLWS